MRQESKGAFEGVEKRGAEKGRIVITCEVTIPRELWGRYKGTIVDAVDCLRQDVRDYEDNYISVEELIYMADDVSVVATK